MHFSTIIVFAFFASVVNCAPREESQSPSVDGGAASSEPDSAVVNEPQPNPEQQKKDDMFAISWPKLSEEEKKQAEDGIDGLWDIWGAMRTAFSMGYESARKELEEPVMSAVKDFKEKGAQSIQNVKDNYYANLESMKEGDFVNQYNEPSEEETNQTTTGEVTNQPNADDDTEKTGVE